MPDMAWATVVGLSAKSREISWGAEESKDNIGCLFLLDIALGVKLRGRADL